MNQVNIGKFIAKLRKDKKMTQEELAYKLGVNNRSISRWETGKCMPDLSLLVPLSKELGVNVNDLLSANKVENDKETFENNISNIVLIAEESKRRFKIKIICILLSIFIILIPIIILCIGQFSKLYYYPSFSSIEIINKANQFYKALQKNDIDKINKLMTDNVEDEMCWFSTEDYIMSKQNFLDNLKYLNGNQKEVEYTSFNIKQFRYIEIPGKGWEDGNDKTDSSKVWVKGCEPTMYGFAVLYELCFKDWTDEKACITLEFTMNKNGKLAFETNSKYINISEKDVSKKYSPIYYPLTVGNSSYNPLHVFVEDVFRGYELENIEINVNSWLNR